MQKYQHVKTFNITRKGQGGMTHTQQIKNISMAFQKNKIERWNGF